LRIVRRFDVPPDKVFDTLTRPDDMRSWWGTERGRESLLSTPDPSVCYYGCVVPVHRDGLPGANVDAAIAEVNKLQVTSLIRKTGVPAESAAAGGSTYRYRGPGGASATRRMRYTCAA
jgi:hypothetical protein